MRFWAVLALLCLAQPAAAQSDADALQTIELRGTIGAYAVGANIIEHNKTDVIAAHYFYAAHCINIPLRTSRAGDTLVFTEPCGAVMHLHFITNDSVPAGTQLNFYNSTGLAGEWSDAGKTLPVRLMMEFSYPGIRAGHWYADVTDEPDAVFEARVQRFLNGALTGNKAEAASAISLPLHVWDKEIKTKAAFYAQWNKIFTPKYLTLLRKAVPHEMFVHDGMAMIGNGEAWFGPNGQTRLQPPE